MSQQLTFADSEFSSKRRQTRKEIFLSRMDNLLPWSQLLEVIEPFYPKAGNGRRVPGSSLVRESDLAFMTQAGAEIGVASTKAFTTQLTAFLMLTLALGEYNGMAAQDKQDIVSALHSLPAKLEETLTITQGIEDLAEEFADKHHSLFLGRGDQYPIAMEGALKLKEISYIHAEAYASGELKHGPLALIDEEMPVIVVAPNNELLEKLKSNVEEVRARGGIMYVFADKDARFAGDETMRVIDVPHCDAPIAPIVYTLPLQLLSYYVALIKGTDVDQPRNLAKSVTVEWFVTGNDNVHVK